MTAKSGSERRRRMADWMKKPSHSPLCIDIQLLDKHWHHLETQSVNLDWISLFVPFSCIHPRAKYNILDNTSQVMNWAKQSVWVNKTCLRRSLWNNKLPPLKLLVTVCSFLQLQQKSLGEGVFVKSKLNRAVDSPAAGYMRCNRLRSICEIWSGGKQTNIFVRHLRVVTFCVVVYTVLAALVFFSDRSLQTWSCGTCTDFSFLHTCIIEPRAARLFIPKSFSSFCLPLCDPFFPQPRLIYILTGA